MSVLTDELRERIRAYLPRYPSKQAVTLPALHLVQDALRCVPPEAVREIADHLAEKLKQASHGYIPIEGKQGGDWVLVDAGDVVVHTDLGPAEAAEVALSPVGARLRGAVGLLVIDPLHLVMAVQRIPGPAFVRVDDGALHDPRLDE